MVLEDDPAIVHALELPSDGNDGPVDLSGDDRVGNVTARPQVVASNLHLDVGALRRSVSFETAAPVRIAEPSSLRATKRQLQTGAKRSCVQTVLPSELSRHQTKPLRSAV